jgi:hypothetical protein
MHSYDHYNTHTHTLSPHTSGGSNISAAAIARWLNGLVTGRGLKPSRRGRTANEGPGTLGGRNRAAYEFGRARNREQATGKLETDAGGGQRSRGGKGGIYGRGEKQHGDCARALPDRAGAKPGGCDTTISIVNYS